MPGFRAFLENFYDVCQRTHLQLLSALERGLRLRGLDVELVSRCDQNVSELRLNYYPQIDIKNLRSGKTNRISEHTDFGTMTLLFQDSVGGLEVEDQTNMGSYIPVSAASSTEMLVNVGDSLQRLSNDMLTSVSHRVTIPECLQDTHEGLVAERYSIAYFAKVGREQSLRPLTPFVDEEHPRRYEDITAYKWNQLKLAKIYG